MCSRKVNSKLWSDEGQQLAETDQKCIVNHLFNTSQLLYYTVDKKIEKVSFTCHGPREQFLVLPLLPTCLMKSSNDPRLGPISLPREFHHKLVLL